MSVEFTDQKNTKKKRSQMSERITLSKSLQAKAQSWLKQANDHCNGMLVLKRNDLICALLDELPAKLSLSSVEKIKSEKLTDMQKAKWIFEKFKEAELKGHSLDFNELVNTANSTSKKKKRSSRGRFKPHKGAVEPPSNPHKESKKTQ